MKKMYKAFIYLNDNNLIAMIIGFKGREYIIEKLADFYRDISGIAEIYFKLKEVTNVNGDYRYK